MFANNVNNYIFFGAEGRPTFPNTAHPAFRFFVFTSWCEQECVLPHQNCRLSSLCEAKYGHCKTKLKTKLKKKEQRKSSKNIKLQT